MNHKTYILISGLGLLATIMELDATTVSTTKEGITLAAEAELESNGKTHITCTLTNNSSYLFASVYPNSPSRCFQFRLLDVSEKHVKQRDDWSLQHAQIESDNPSLAVRGLNDVYIHPSEKREFQFDLEDAYGDKSAQGRVLEVKWNNYFAGPGGTISVDERKGSDGKIIPAHEEVNHFPGLWTASVSLPLPRRAEDEKAAPDSDRPSANPTPEKTSQEIPVNKAPPLATSTPKSPPTFPNPWWWALLAIPALILGWLGLRFRKQT